MREGDHLALVRKKSLLRARLSPYKALGANTDECIAFVGTDSLHLMQNAMFDATYNTRENLLICAPTGAGKTNVAMLVIVLHLRDLGLIGASFHGGITTTKEGRSPREEDSVHRHDEGTGP